MSSKTFRGMVACTCVLAISSWLNAAEVSSANTSQLTSQRALAALVREVLNSNPAVQAAQIAAHRASSQTHSWLFLFTTLYWAKSITIGGRYAGAGS